MFDATEGNKVTLLKGNTEFTFQLFFHRITKQTDSANKLGRTNILYFGLGKAENQNLHIVQGLNKRELPLQPNYLHTF